jgi:trk system potassium uptake protein TrkA
MERYAVIGLGRFGRRLAQLLTESGTEVIGVDRSREVIEAVGDKITRAVCLNCTDEAALRSQGIDEVDVAVVGIGTDFEDAVLTTVLLKQLGVPRVISRATSVMRANILARVGADEVVNPERESAARWRTRLVAPKVMDQIDLAEDCSLAQIAPPSHFVGKTLGQLDVRNTYQVQVVAIRRTAEDVDAEGQTRTRQYVISVPMADTEIRKDDVLIVIGSNDALKQFH